MCKQQKSKRGRKASERDRVYLNTFAFHYQFKVGIRISKIITNIIMTSWENILQRLSFVDFSLLHVLYETIQTIRKCQYRNIDFTLFVLIATPFTIAKITLLQAQGKNPKIYNDENRRNVAREVSSFSILVFHLMKVSENCM